MRDIFRNAGHLIRPAVVLLALFGLFLVVRGAFIPKTFGQYGHYDAASLERVRQQPISYAGQDACVMCHDGPAEARAEGPHARVACETCHGQQQAHAVSGDPSAHKPALPESGALCSRCHERDAAKPKSFPQVVSADHSGGANCGACHQPHNPRRSK